MAPVVAELVALQGRPDRVRNLCILAHVDHGKTSLTDALISSNGIISSRQAGRLRYMDSRDDEQDRGITMKASAIALVYAPPPSERGAAAPERDLINLVDSPGHVDFGTEVSTAVRLADGAVIVVDAVEGVCVQTHTVLQQVWREKLAPILFINKLDRLITELQLDPEEAYAHLQRIVAQVNAILGGLHAVEHYARADQTMSAPPCTTQGSGAVDAGASGEVVGGGMGDDFEFRPEAGNVVFGSALHGWGFTTADFASLMASRLGVSEVDAGAHLWGQWFFSPKAKAFTRDSSNGKLKPLFAQLVLANVWRAHAAASAPGDEGMDQLSKVIGALKLTVPPTDLKSTDPVARARGVLSAWMPLAPALLRAVRDHVPAAPLGQLARTSRLWDEALLRQSTAVAAAAVGASHPGGDSTHGEAAISAGVAETLSRAEAEALVAARDAVQACDPSSELVVAHVSKMFVNCRGESAVGFARVYSGTLRRGAELWLSPAPGSARGGATPPSSAFGASVAAAAAEAEAGGADGASPATGSGAGPGAQPVRVPAGVVQPLLMMGRDLVAVEEVPAGSLCALGGLGDYVVKGATLSSRPHVPSFRPLWSEGGAGGGAPIVRVALEATNPLERSKLHEGLRRLQQADPSALVETVGGEVVLATCGEVHLERCLRDLREDFARVDMSVSQPLIPFRESLEAGSAGHATVVSADRRVRVRVAVRPLHPAAVTALARRVGLAADVGGTAVGAAEDGEAEGEAGPLAGEDDAVEALDPADDDSDDDGPRPDPVEDRTSFRHFVDETLVRYPGDLKGANFELEGLNNCEVLLLDVTSQVTIDRCKNCRILIAPVNGSVFLRDSKSCMLSLACKQLRTRACSHCDLFVHTRGPIVETSSGMRFERWNCWYPGAAEHFAKAELDPEVNDWNNVYDFNADDDTTPQPHWSIMPPEEFLRWEVQFEGEGEARLGLGAPDNPVPLPDDYLEAELEQTVVEPPARAQFAERVPIGKRMVDGKFVFVYDDDDMAAKPQAPPEPATVAGHGSSTGIELAEQLTKVAAHDGWARMISEFVQSHAQSFTRGEGAADRAQQEALFEVFQTAAEQQLEETLDDLQVDPEEFMGAVHKLGMPPPPALGTPQGRAILEVTALDDFNAFCTLMTLPGSTSSENDTDDAHEA